MELIKKTDGNKIVMSKKAFVSLVSISIKGENLFKDKADNAKKVLKGNADFVPFKSK